MKHLFFVGIAGHAMRGLAYTAGLAGNKVSGLDVNAIAPGSDWLDEHEITWTKFSSPTLLDSIDQVIISGGTAADDPILLEAAQRGIPVISFAEYLGTITTGKRVISVAGSHGKTTTTALITWLLESAGRHPDFLIGIQPFNFDSSARLTGADIVVVEGDEYKASSIDTRSKVQFYHPDVLVLTSVEMDHPDVFKDLAAITTRFIEIVAQVPASGSVIAWIENPAVRAVARHAAATVIPYGLETGAVKARNVRFAPSGLIFDLEVASVILGQLDVPLFGRHNILNALAASAVALGEGLEIEAIQTGMKTFRGAYRRFNILTPPDAAITVIDDYAHHPTEVITTIEAAKLHYPKHRIIAVFRPHTYSRTKTLLSEFQAAFTGADKIYITGIEGAREAGQAETVSGSDVASGIGEDAVYVPGRTELADLLVADAGPADVILCMTVSGYEKLANEVASRTNQL